MLRVDSKNNQLSLTEVIIVVKFVMKTVQLSRLVEAWGYRLVEYDVTDTDDDDCNCVGDCNCQQLVSSIFLLQCDCNLQIVLLSRFKHIIIALPDVQGFVSLTQAIFGFTIFIVLHSAHKTFVYM